MPILSGYSAAALLADALLGSIVIAIDSATAYGMTSGEPTINIPHEYDNLNFDGKIGIPIRGLDRRVGGVVSIEGVFIEVNPTKALDFEPGGTTLSSGGITTITPALFGDFLPTSAYKENARAFMRRAGGGIVCIEFNSALLIVDSLTGASADKGSVKLRLEARQLEDASSLGVAPYTIKLAADIATIVAADP